MHAQLADGRPFRVSTVVDHWTPQSRILEPGVSLHGSDVAPALDWVLATGVQPRSVTLDHGTEFTSRALEDWRHG